MGGTALKGLFIYYKQIDMSNLTGIDKKVLWQLEQLNINSLNCKLHIQESGINNFFDRIFLRLPFSNKSPKWTNLTLFNEVDYIYFRRPPAITKTLIDVLSEVKIKNPHVKIIMEIPTFPYDNELSMKWYNYPLLIKDRYNRIRLKEVVDRIAIQNNIDCIFGIPTLKFKNGIKIDEVKIREPINNQDDVIRICAVASMYPWQGYERVILSLEKYYKNNGEENVEIHIVGEGPELEQYKKITKQSGLTNRIIFHGYKTKRELDNIYNICDLTLDAFGRYKTKNLTSTSLKSREYIAKGLPVISGSKSDLFSRNNEIYLEFSNDDSLFDFTDIIEFHKKIYRGKEKAKVAREIRDYAYEICDISNSMNEIIDFIKDQQD